MFNRIQTKSCITKDLEPFVDQFAVLEALPQLVFVLNDSGEFAFVNKHEHLHLIGTGQNHLGQKMVDCIFPADVEPVQHALNQIISGKVLEKVQVRLPKEHEVYFLELSCSPLCIGPYSLILISVNEVTELVQIKTQKEQLADELTQLVDTANAPIFGIDVKGNVNEWNQKAAQITGFSKDEVLGKPFVQTYITDDYKASVKHVLDEALKGTETSNYEVPIFTKGGQRVVVLLNATTRRDIDGNIIGVVGVGQDITEMVDVTHRMEAIADNSLALIYTYEMDKYGKDRITYANTNVEDVFGIDRAEFMADLTCFWANVVPEHLERVKKEIYHSFEMKINFSSTYQYQHPTKGLRWITARSSPRDLLHGSVAWDGLIIDVTEEKNLQQQLLVAQAEQKVAEEKNKLKSDFLANMSHELRTPLNAILGFSELLKMELPGKLNNKQKRYVGEIHAGGNHLLKLINELLQLTKLEAGKFDLLIESFDSQIWVEDCLAALVNLALAKKIVLNIDKKSDKGMICADKVRLTQVLYNLVSNAIKFSKPQTNVYVLIQRHLDGWLISVTDQGIGISKNNQGAIFEKFTQLENPLDKNAEGTGLGLPLARSLVEAHGGKLWLQNSTKRGSVFCFSIPFVNE